MLVYDISNEKSFENIKNWIRNIEEVSSVEFAVLAGNGNVTGNRCLRYFTAALYIFLAARLV